MTRKPFSWQGHNKTVSGDGVAQLTADGSLGNLRRFHNGDASTLEARPW